MQDKSLPHHSEDLIDLPQDKHSALKMLCQQRLWEKNINIRDQYGYTPLHLAISCNNVEIFEFFLENGANAYNIHNKGRSTLDSALSCENAIIIKKLLLATNNQIIHCLEHEAENIWDTITQIAIKCDDVELFKYILRFHYPRIELFLNLEGKNHLNINEFLDYSPGCKELKIKEILQRQYDQNFMENLIYDFDHTSEESSSDDEMDRFYFLKEKINPSDKILYRGFHFSPTYFPNTEKRNIKLHASHDQTAYSLAAKNLSERQGITLEQSDQLIKNYFNTLKTMPDQNEIRQNGTRRYRKVKKKTKKFASLHDHLVHAYVNPHGYTELFQNGGMERNFNFWSNDNPTLSTTPDISIAFQYTSGERITEMAKYHPKVRCSTKRLKHRRVGYIEVYGISESYFSQHGIDVNALKKAERISIAHNQSFNQEIIIESSIPKEFIVGYQILSLPSFKEPYSESIHQHYGFTQAEYLTYQNQLSLQWKDGKVDLTEALQRIRGRQARVIKENMALLRSNKGSNIFNNSFRFFKGLPLIEKSVYEDHLVQLALLNSLKEFEEEREFYNLKSSQEFTYIEGNCLFDSISYQDSEERSPARLRALCVNVIRHSKTLQNAVKAGINKEIVRSKNGDKPYRSLDEYLYLMSKNQTWGTYIEIIALSIVLQRPIICLTPNNAYDEIITEEEYKNNPPIFLNYIGKNHYTPLILPDEFNFQAVFNQIKESIALRSC